MWRKLSKPWIIALASASVALAVLCLVYRLVDPLPPHRLTIAGGAAGSGYDNFARQYARILARHGVTLEVRNAAGAVENLELLRDAASGVQAALTTFGFTQPEDAETLQSLGGVFDADGSRFFEFRARVAEIESAVRSIRIARSYEVDLQLLRFHLRAVQEELGRLKGTSRDDGECRQAAPVLAVHS